MFKQHLRLITIRRFCARTAQARAFRTKFTSSSFPYRLQHMCSACYVHGLRARIIYTLYRGTCILRARSSAPMYNVRRRIYASPACRFVSKNEAAKSRFSHVNRTNPPVNRQPFAQRRRTTAATTTITTTRTTTTTTTVSIHAIVCAFVYISYFLCTRHSAETNKGAKPPAPLHHCVVLFLVPWQ